MGREKRWKGSETKRRDAVNDGEEMMEGEEIDKLTRKYNKGKKMKRTCNRKEG